MSPTQRTLTYLRDLGYTAAIVERWNPHSRTRADLFGFADLLALHANQDGVLAVQTTSGANHASRLAKTMAAPAAKLWVMARNQLWIVSWAKRGPRGKRKVWEPRIETIEVGDFV